jgi:hypothetical protein
LSTLWSQLDGKYKGELVEGLREGPGVLTWANGDTYTGNFHAGLRSGRGVFKQSDGLTYDGEWRLSRRHGQGAQSWPNGDHYSGAWQSDVFHGQGALSRHSGRYVGQVSLHFDYTSLYCSVPASIASFVCYSISCSVIAMIAIIEL